MIIMEFKIPTSKEEMDALRKSLVQEISDDDLDNVAGGNDDPKGKVKNGVAWTCPFCKMKKILYSANDGPKHMTQDCPANPYKLSPILPPGRPQNLPGALSLRRLPI